MLKEMVDDVVLDLSAIDKISGADATLREELGFDSLKMVELLVALEEEFEIEFDEGDLEPSLLICVKDIYSLVGKYSLSMSKN